MRATKLTRLVLGAIVGFALTLSASPFTSQLAAAAPVGSNCVLQCTPTACCTVNANGDICDCEWKDDEAT